MRMFLILGLGLLAGVGLYMHQKNQPAPIQQMEKLPPPPPPPPPPTLSREELNEAVANTEHFTASVRTAALNSLAKNWNRGIDGVLGQRLRVDPEVGIRLQILVLLASRHKPGADKQEDEANTALILQGMRDTEKSVRMATLQSIQSVQGRSAANPLTRYLYDTDVEVRKGILRTISVLVGQVNTNAQYISGGSASYALPPDYEATYQKALAHAYSAQASSP